ncbi:MAG: ATP-binding protein [Alphaproteobacteria bacterium]|nr:ATP-binding protein [Alphaproteobacteria bacterium]
MASQSRATGGIGARRSIGIALLLVAGLLTALFAGLVVLAGQEYRCARDVAVADRISKNVAQAVTDLGVVRGFTMTYLVRAEPAPASGIAALDRRHNSGSDLLAAARADLAMHRPGLLPAIDSIRDRTREAWARAQVQLRLPRERRDAVFSEGWFAAYTVIIGDLEKLLVDVRDAERLLDMHFAFLADLRVAILRWRLLRTREMGIVGARVSAGTPGTPAMAAEIDALRGRADTLLAQIRLHVDSLRSGTLADALKEVDGALVPLNASFERAREAWHVGAVTPIAPVEQDRLSFGAIDAINRLIAAISDEAQRYAADTQSAALRRSFASFALFAAGLTLAFLSWRMLARAVIEPLEDLSGVARRIAAGDRDARAAVRGAAEIQQAADQFNLMLDTLRRYQHELERSNRALDQGQREIAARERRLRAVTDNLPAFIAYLDRDGRLEFANKAAEQWLNRPASRLVGLRAAEVMPAGPWPHAASGAEPQPDRSSGQSSMEFPDGVRRDVEFTLVPDIEAQGGIAGHFVLALDVTERRRAEEQLLHAQRVEAIGKLTGGVAHDFNNLLAVISGNLELLEEGLQDRPDLRGLAHSAIRASDRGATLTRSLLAFARRQALMPSAVDLNRLVDEMSELIRRTMPENITLNIVHAPDLWPCTADGGQLQNALLNLVVNARDAMPDGGSLTIETANASLTDEYAVQHMEVRPGEYVVLAVSDTGCGMPSDVAARAFEPFFTTKGPGKGTGLGLSMVYGFAKQSNGHATIYSEVGAGTTVRVYLPRSAAAVDGRRPPPAPHHRAEGPERVLVVEDDPDVLELVNTLLRSLGYHVERARDGAEALRVLARDEAIALLLTDVVLAGGMNGPALADRALAERPDLRVMFMSGYTENATLQNGRLKSGVRLLQKPFTKADLAASVRAALDERAGA